MAIGPSLRTGAVLEIDLEAIAANWRALRARAAPGVCAAVVKADAYGLGAAEVAPVLAAAGCRLFFVATLDEAIALRRVLAEACEVAVFNGPVMGSAAEMAALGLIPVLNNPGQIAEWREAAVCSAPALLHVDTGMARLGLTVREFDDFADRQSARDGIRWRGLISHLACADEPADPMNELQRARFVAASERFSRVPASLAASSGIFLGPAFHFDFVRPGAALYGVNPQPAAPSPMRPVVRLNARILQIREVEEGQTVGYGAAHKMAQAGRLATVAVGYADGLLRSLSHRGCGFIDGQRVPLVGRISIHLAKAQPGAFIELLGEQYGVDDAAADAGTIGYEILTALGPRYHRIYRGRPVQC
jgi:alanine racemase